MEELKGLAASMGLYDDRKPCKRAVILGKAIKALEQGDVLNKIRAEIEQLHHHPKLDFINTDKVVDMAIEIIDKYKAESEKV